MLWHVCRGVSQAKLISEVWVLSDSEEVFEAAISWGVKALMTSEECPSGTDRIASVMDSLNGDVIVNVQGDEPLIESRVVDQLITSLNSSSADVATPVYRITSQDDLANPNVVKAVRALDGSALYFSRSQVPYVRDAETADLFSNASFWGHAGVYAYRRNVLEEFPRLPEGRLERVERLEQLRLLESGKKILTVEIDYRPRAVDVPADLEAVERILDQSGDLSSGSPRLRD